jgi:hypothetical protein
MLTIPFYPTNSNPQRLVRTICATSKDTHSPLGSSGLLNESGGEFLMKKTEGVPILGHDADHAMDAQGSMGHLQG